MDYLAKIKEYLGLYSTQEKTDKLRRMLWGTVWLAFVAKGVLASRGGRRHLLQPTDEEEDGHLRPQSRKKDVQEAQEKGARDLLLATETEEEKEEREKKEAIHAKKRGTKLFFNISPWIRRARSCAGIITDLVAKDDGPGFLLLEEFPSPTIEICGNMADRLLEMAEAAGFEGRGMSSFQTWLGKNRSRISFYCTSST